MEEKNKQKDVRINVNGKRFKFRVAGIIEHENKVLLVRMNDNPFYCFPGGHVELLEETSHAAQRELDEELYFKVKVKDLLFIHENFFEAKGEKFHEMCFYFKADPMEENFKAVDKNHKELDCGQWVNHEYKWIDKNELKKVGAQPRLIIDSYINGDENFLHLVTNDLKG